MTRRPAPFRILARPLAGFGTLALLAASLHAGVAAGQADPPERIADAVLGLLPTTEADAEGSSRFRTDYAPSGSEWVKGADERDVFKAELQHVTDDADRAWTMRLGKGGMIYSFRGPFGESIPPQRDKSMWNDEVWQLVAVNHERLKPAQGAGAENRELREDLRSFFYFAHQSGTYDRDPEFPGTFFSPQLAENIDEDSRSYRSLNWIQQAHVPSVWPSGLLCYQSVRDAGNGVVELTYVLHNAGDVAIDHLNTPWGGVRHSSLPDILVSQPEGKFRVSDVDFSEGKASRENLGKLDGWAGWAVDAKDPASHALLLVLGEDPKKLPKVDAGEGVSLKPQKTNGPSVYRWGKALHNPPGRDYSVSTLATKADVLPGETFLARSFFVVGPLKEAVDTARSLVPMAGVGQLVVSERDSPRVAVGTAGGETVSAYAWPVPGSRPLVLLRDTRDGSLLVSSDLNHGSPTEPAENVMPAGHPERAIYDDRSFIRPAQSPFERLALLGFLPDAGGATLPSELETGWGTAAVADDTAGMHGLGAS